MEDRLAQLTQSLDKVHRRLDALERQVLELPERFGRAMGSNAGAAADGAHVFNLVVQAISTSIIQTVTDNLRITAPNAPRSQSSSTDTSPKESVRPLPSQQNNIDTPYNAVPMHHLSSRSPMSPEPAPMVSITREMPVSPSFVMIPRQSLPRLESPIAHRVVGKEFIWPD